MLAAGFGIAGVTKLLDLDRVRDHLGYSALQYRLIGLTEIVGAALVVVGLVWRKVEWIAGAAAVGFICLTLGAMMAHARAEDEWQKIMPALAMLVASGVFVIAISLR